MSKGFAFWVLILVAAMLCHVFSSSAHGTVPDSFDNVRGRKLKTFLMHTNDYIPDPTPTSSIDHIRSGPIQHGTPLMPYIPKPTPPGIPPDTRCFSTNCDVIDSP